ncbi:hypothetical protein CNECB9_1790012 [Cupriavidus necator]|uniref:Uncharacterized protein n=1 Tax=Cupriavidus necator TaxID=106590 RepID=A0A1K0IC99_CUPNE|nr:hypothetical protein CNECB9_1790012 [Cupriavidus necator]
MGPLARRLEINAITHSRVDRFISLRQEKGAAVGSPIELAAYGTHSFARVISLPTGYDTCSHFLAQREELSLS